MSKRRGGFRVPPFPMPARLGLAAWRLGTRLGLSSPSLEEEKLISAARKRTGLQALGDELGLDELELAELELDELSELDELELSELGDSSNARATVTGSMGKSSWSRCSSPFRLYVRVTRRWAPGCVAKTSQIFSADPNGGTKTRSSRKRRSPEGSSSAEISAYPCEPPSDTTEKEYH